MKPHHLRVLHITPAFYPATSFGGPIFSTLGLCDALAQQGNVSLRVLTTDTTGPARADRIKRASFPVNFPAGYAVYYCRKLFGKDTSFEMFWRLFGMVRWAEVVHLTGVYSPPTIPTLLLCRLLRKPLVWSPRGGLQRWEGATRPLVKRLWEAVCNLLVVTGRCVLHVTSDEEAKASMARIPKASAILIHNGIDIPPAKETRVRKPDGMLRLLFLGRLHPIKGIENLLAAIAAPEFTRMALTICGDGDPAYKAKLETKVSELGLDNQVAFSGHVTGNAKRSAYAEADVCVVPSFTENFGMVVVEALAHGVPVIVSKGAPWAEVETRGCGLWVANTPNALAAALRDIRTRDLADMGSQGRVWMEKDYAWVSIANRMYSLYTELIGE